MAQSSTQSAPSGTSGQGATDISRGARLRMVLRRLSKNWFAVFGAVVAVTLVLTAIFAPVIAPYGPTEADYNSIREAPSLDHPFGTDNLGRDIFSRVVFGSRYTVFLGIVIVGIQMVIGVSLGLIAGYYGGWLESIIMRLVDISLSIPGIVLALAIAGIMGGGIESLIIAVSLVGWRGFTRLVRGDVKSIMEEEYIDAAESAGVGDIRIMTRYILPNSMSSIIVYTSLTIPTVILWSAALSFLGMGVQPPRPEWGAIISIGRSQLAEQWWVSTFPGVAIMVTVIGFNALGDGLRDALDPKQE